MAANENLYPGAEISSQAVQQVTLDSLDKDVFWTFNKLLATPCTDWLMPWISDVRVYLPGLILLAVFLIFRDRARGRWVLVGIGLLILLTDWTTSQIWRPLFERPRPWAALVGVHYFKHGAWLVTTPEIVAQAKNVFGLPSAHAANSFGLATYLVNFYPRLGRALMIAAGVIGLSRIYLGMHYPGDILAGFIWGGLSGMGVAWLVKKVGRVR